METKTFRAFYMCPQGFLGLDLLSLGPCSLFLPLLYSSDQGYLPYVETFSFAVFFSACL